MDGFLLIPMGQKGQKGQQRKMSRDALTSQDIIRFTHRHPD